MAPLNYEDILNIEASDKLAFSIISFLFLSLILIMFFYESYSVIDYDGMYDGKNVIITLKYDVTNIIKSGEYIVIDEKEYDYSIKSYGDIFLVADEYFQSIYLDIDADLKKNEVIKITVFYNKNKMIKKIINVIY